MARNAVKRTGIYSYWLKIMLLLAGLVSGPSLAEAQLCTAQTLNADKRYIDPITNLCFLEDPSGSVTLDDIRNSRVTLTRAASNELVFSHTESVYWLHLRLTNQEGQARFWFLALNYAPLDHVTFYLAENGALHSRTTGDRHPFSSRAVDYRYFLQPLQFQADETKEVFIRVQSTGAINLPLTLHRPEHLLESASRTALLQGLFYGALLILSIFNGLLFITTRTPHYFYNSFFMLSTGIFLFSMGGLSNQFLWPDSPWLANAAIPISEAVLVLAFTLFGRSFLEVDGSQRLIARILSALTWINGINTILAFVLPYTLIIKWITLCAMVSILTLYIVGIIRLRQGYTPARWYLLAWTLMFLGSAIYALAAFGYIANYFANEILMQLAIGGQVLLLNYALVLRVRLLNEKLLAVEADAKLALEQQVRDRTRQLEHALRELESANHKLEELSTRDKLTGLYNRRYFDDALHTAITDARRLHGSVALVLLDVDHFKAVNDQHGHPIGDQCLQHIARVMTNIIRRPSDTLARYGGEEFAVILPFTDEEGAAHVISRLLETLRATGVQTDVGVIRITVSAGLAMIHPAREPQEDERSLVRRADDALYQAKRNGRDRLVISMSPEVLP